MWWLALASLGLAEEPSGTLAILVVDDDSADGWLAESFRRQHRQALRRWKRTLRRDPESAGPRPEPPILPGVPRVAGADIEITGFALDLRGVTGRDGRYTATVSPGNDLWVEVHHPGYTLTRITGVSVKRDEVTELLVLLHERE